MPETQGSPPTGTVSGADETPAGAGGGNAVGGKRPGKSKALVYAAIVLAGAGGAGWWLRTPGAAPAVTAESSEATLPLETFVVNLDSGGQRAYLRVGITLGLSRALPRGGKDDVPVALLRDVILSVLSNAHPEQLLTAEGKQKLKSELLKSLQERAPAVGVANVYFTEFLVQM